MGFVTYGLGAETPSPQRLVPFDQGIQGYTRVCKGIQGYTWVYMGIVN